MKIARPTLLCLCIVFQLVVLTGEYVNSVYPRWIGKKINLKTVPIDPRSLFRGQYARLNYDISRLSPPVFSLHKELVAGKNLREGEIVYVSLVKDSASEIWRAESVSLKKPESGIFIRGRLVHTKRNDDVLDIKYGIEAFFASPKRALEIESMTRTGDQENKEVYAEVMLAPNGKASLVDVKQL